MREKILRSPASVAVYLANFTWLACPVLSAHHALLGNLSIYVALSLVRKPVPTSGPIF